MIDTNDPNTRFGTHECEVTFMLFKCRNSIVVKVGGNCKGFDILKAAVDQAVEKVYENGLDLNTADGTLRLDPHEHEDHELEQMIISVTILSFEQEKKP